MMNFCKTGLGLAAAGLALALAAPSASAKPFELIYTGTFNGTDALNPANGVTDSFPDATPFLVKAFFDDSSPNLAAPVGVAGFAAYSPTSATLTIGRDTFNFATYNQDPAHGVSVAIYDDTTPFEPGHYGVGLLQNPLADGAGFIGDWLSAAPTFSASHLVPTVFTKYQGVGYGAGPDPQHTGNPSAVPIPLTDAHGSPFVLTLGNYDEELSQGGVQNTAKIIALPVPEASTTVSLGLLLALGMGGVVVAAKRKKQNA